LLASASAFAQGEAPAAEERILLAVLPIETAAGKDATGLVEGALRDALGRDPRFALQPAEVTAAEVEAATSLGVECTWGEVECLSRLAIILRVERIISGRLTPEGTLDLVALNADSGVLLAEVSRELPESVGERATLAAELAKTILAEPGRLLLRARRDGLVIVVDGDVLGRTPLTEPIALPAGPHIVELLQGAVKLGSKTLELREGELLEHDWDAKPEEPATASAAPREEEEQTPWLLIGGTTAAVGGLLALAGLGGIVASESLLFTDYGDYDDRKLLQNVARGSIAGAAVGAFVVVVGGVLIAVPLLEE
jgi:hypothetical protein